MTELLEVGQIGIIQDYPAELIQIENKLAQSQAETANLSGENDRLKDVLIIAGALFVVGLLYLAIKEQNKDREEQS